MIITPPHHKWALRPDCLNGRLQNGACLAMVLAIYLAGAVLCGLIAFLPQYVYAQTKQAPLESPDAPFSSLMLQENDRLFVLTPYMSLIPDDPGKTTLDAITTIHQRGAYRLDKDDYQFYLHGNGLAYWLVFSINNTSDITNWVLDMGDFTRGRSGVVKEIFIYDHTNRKILKNLLLPQNADEPLKTSSPFFQLSLPAKSQSDISIFVSTHKGVHTILSPRLIPQDIWYETYTTNMPALLIIIAISFLTLGLILTGYIYTSWLSRLCMTGYVLSVLTSLRLSQQNFLIQNDAQAYMGIIFIGLGLFLAYLASLFQCHSQKHLRTAISRLSGVLILSAISIAGALKFAPVEFQMAGYFGAGFIFILGMIYICVLPKSNHVTLGHALSWGGLLVGYLIFTCVNFNITPPSNFGQAAFALGFLAQLIILMLMGRQEDSNLWTAERFTPKKQNDTNDENVEKSLLIALQRIKENSDYQKLLKVVERERITMHELREKEAERVEQMRQSKDEADLANRAKSAFLAMVSHEIRTPMTGIMGMVSLLKDTTLNDQQDDYIDTIQESSKTMLSLLNDILDFEKIETGQMELEIVDFDLHRLIQSVTSLMNGHATVKHNQLLTNMGKNVPKYVRGDPTRLRQVILNLVGNAIKFTSNGTITLNIQNLQDGDQPDDNNQYDIYFSVEDTGIGIPKEAQRNLFNPFVQADKSTSRKYGGSGLGLAISQKLIGAMGGFISVNSREGVGSTFFFSIMLSGGDQKRAQDIDNKQASKTNLPGYDEIKRNQYRQAQGRIPTPPPISETSGDMVHQDTAPPPLATTHDTAPQIDNNHIAKHILVIDDNAINRKVLSGLISRLNHHVALAESGRQGVDMAQEKIWDLIFMDIEMPDISGVDATIQILSHPNPAISQTPIIALTGNMRDQDTAAYIQAGMRASLGKPVDPDKLKDMIDAYPHRTSSTDHTDQESQENQGDQGSKEGQGSSGLAPQAQIETEDEHNATELAPQKPSQKPPQKPSGEISDQDAQVMFASDDADDLNSTELFRPKQRYEAPPRPVEPPVERPVEAPVEPPAPINTDDQAPENDDSSDNFYEDDLGKPPMPASVNLPLSMPPIFTAPASVSITPPQHPSAPAAPTTSPAPAIEPAQATAQATAPQVNIAAVKTDHDKDLESAIEDIERQRKEKQALAQQEKAQTPPPESIKTPPKDDDDHKGAKPKDQPVAVILSQSSSTKDTAIDATPSLSHVKAEIETQPPFHADVLAVLADNLKPEDLKQLIDDFWAKTDETISFLQNPGNWQDMAKMRQAAHDIKGMAGNFGLMQISVLGGFIEDAARGEHLDKAKLFIGEFMHYFPDGKDALTQWLDNILSQSNTSSDQGDADDSDDTDTSGDTSGDQSSPLFDADILQVVKQSMNDVQLMGYLKGFCAKIEGEINGLKSAISGQDMANTAKKAEEIYLMAHNFGLIKIQDLAGQIKSLLTSSAAPSPDMAQNQLQDLSRMANDLSITMDKTRHALEHWVEPVTSTQQTNPTPTHSMPAAQNIALTPPQPPALSTPANEKPASDDLDYDMLELLKDSMNTTQIISMINAQWKKTDDIIRQLDIASNKDDAAQFTKAAEHLITMCDKLGLIALTPLAHEAKQAGQTNDQDMFALLSAQITAKAKSARESLDQWIRA